MSIGPAKQKTKPRKPDGEFANCAFSEPLRCVARNRHPHGTPAGAAAVETIARIQTEGQIRALTEKVSMLERLVDPRDVEAFRELKLITPTAEEFAEMASDSGPPPVFVEEPDDAP